MTKQKVMRSRIKELREENEKLRAARNARDIELARKIEKDLAGTSNRGPFYTRRAWRRG